MSRATAKFNELKDSTSWKPSDLSAKVPFIAMMNKQLQTQGKQGDNKNKNKKKKEEKGKNTNKKPPPCTNQQGKSGNTKEWDGHTWHYCPFDHKGSHWVLHNPKDCQMAKAKGNTKMKNANNGGKKQVQVDAEKLRSAIAQLQDSESSGPNEVACAVLAVLDLQE